MIVTWSIVKAVAEGTFDISYKCPSCGYDGWARATVEATGTDGGAFGTASYAHAHHIAQSQLEHAAMRAVHGSPCPQCGEHHPQIVTWAENGAKENESRARLRKISWGVSVVDIVLTAIAIALGVEPALAITLGMMLVAAGPAGWFGFKPAVRWVLHEKPPDSVKFTPPTAYR